MAWLQKRPQVSDPTMFYSVGLNKTIMLIGLGNPGKQYISSRHNIGYMCIDAFVSQTEEMSDWIQKKDLKSIISTGRLGDKQVIAVKPTTYMNLSGQAVEAATRFYNIMPHDILVIHDELDIDFGQIRLRNGGSDAGHNGIKSISQSIGEDYGRVRIGIGPKRPDKIKSEIFVLQKFTEDEQEQLTNLIREVNSIISEYAYSSSNLPQETRSFLV